MNIEEIERELRKYDQLLIVYGKGMSHLITNLTNNHWISEKFVNGEMMFDKLGEYRMIYSMDTKIEQIVDLLNRECFGYSVREIIEDKKDNEIEGMSE